MRSFTFDFYKPLLPIILTQVGRLVREKRISIVLRAQLGKWQTFIADKG